MTLLFRVGEVEAFRSHQPKLNDGRWHLADDTLIYFAESPASATLEALVHAEIDSVQLAQLIVWTMREYRAPNSLGVDVLNVSQLSSDWRTDWAICQSAVRFWHESPEAAPALRVPSALAPGEFNLLVQPARLKRRFNLVSSTSFVPDARLLDPARRRFGTPE